MNKNKIIFIIISIIIAILVFWGVFLLNSSSKNTANKSKTAGDFVIWTYGLDKTKLDEVVKWFKSKAKNYESKNIVVENFANYDDYKETLLSSIISWKAPDIFLLNNFEKSYLENSVLWINPSAVNPNDFRKNYKTFFVDNLVKETTDQDGKKVEFVMGIPVWYETLGIYYNRKFNVKASDLWSWAWVGNFIDYLKERNPEIVPLWIMNSTIDNNSDVMTQFFMLSESSPVTLDKVSEVWVKEAFGSYQTYFNQVKTSSASDNPTETQYYDGQNSWKTNLELFSEWNEAMLVGYPSMINALDEAWFNSAYLFAEPFPHYFSWKWKTLAKYSYFVVNKNTKNETLAFDFLTYLSSEEWAKTFLGQFTYLLPAMVTLEQDKLWEKIHPSYNLTLSDFYKGWDDSLLSSFDKWIEISYDQELKNILKDNYGYLEKFKKFQKVILCKYKKIYNIEDLSVDCEK